MKMKLILAAGLAAFVAAASLAATCAPFGGDDDSGGAGAPTRLELAPIDDLELIVRESFPPQYALQVTSGLPSGCAEFHGATMERTGDTITVTVQNRMPASPDVACTMIYGTHEETVELGSDFVSGREYTVKVNDRDLTFTAQ